MDFITAVKTCLSKYAVFHGRATRSEFWWFELFLVLVALAVPLISVLLMGPVVTEHVTVDGGPAGQTSSMFWAMGSVGVVPHLVNLALALPALAVNVRRLHDVGRSGWWVLIMFVPLFGFLLLLFWWVQPSEPRDNAYGPAPYPALPGI